MKLEHDLIKDLLESIEKECDGNNPINSSNFEKDEWTKEQISYHIQILCDDNLIETGKRFRFQGPGQVFNYPILRLTMEGHRVLEAMRNDTLWNKIKNEATAAGISGLRQIPALAIKVIVGKLNG